MFRVILKNVSVNRLQMLGVEIALYGVIVKLANAIENERRFALLVARLLGLGGAFRFIVAHGV